MSSLRHQKFLQTIRQLSIIILLLCFCRTYSQSIDSYLRDIETGNIGKVEKEMPLLIQEHGETPSILFLRGMLERDGELAVAIFKDLASNYPTSEWADDALMKVAEYFYAKGLYIQAATYLKRIPIYYSYSPHVARSIRLLITSLEVAGKQDSADFYRQIFSLKYPGMQIDLPPNKPFYLGQVSEKKESGNQQVPNTEGTRERDTIRTSIDKMFSDLEAKIKEILPGEKDKTDLKESANIVKQPQADNVEYNYTVQVGAFSKKQNALNIQSRFKSLGYYVYIKEIKKENLTLYGVRVGRFTTIDESRAFGETLKKRHGIDNFYIVKYSGE